MIERHERPDRLFRVTKLTIGADTVWSRKYAFGHRVERIAPEALAQGRRLAPQIEDQGRVVERMDGKGIETSSSALDPRLPSGVPPRIIRLVPIPLQSGVTGSVSSRSLLSL